MNIKKQKVLMKMLMFNKNILNFECIIFFSGLKICKSFLKFEDKKYIRISWNLKICNFFFEIWKDKKEFSLLKKSEKGASMKFGACFLILHTII